MNLELRTLSGGGLQETQFSRYLAGARFSAQEAGAGKAGPHIKWDAGPNEPAEPIRINVGAAHGTDTNSLDAIHPMQGGCTGLKLIDKQIADTVIGELRTPPDTLSATFIYGKRADSEISVAARGARGPWELSGSHHIANAQGAAIRQSASGAEHLIVRTRFRYDKYETVCPSGRREKVVPGEWMGDVMPTPTSQIGCLHAPEDRLGRYGPKSGFERNRERAVQWAGAVDVFGVGLAARSGYSTQVHADWTFGTDGLHLLCGDDAAPWKSKHIYAGFSA